MQGGLGCGSRQQPCSPARPQPRGEFGREGLSGWLPTLRPCCGHSSGTKGACWLCVRSCGPRGHLGSTLSQAGPPQAAFEGWGSRGSSQPACWRVAHLARPAPSVSAALSGPCVVLGGLWPWHPWQNKGTKGDACCPTPTTSDGCSLGAPARGPLSCWSCGLGVLIQCHHLVAGLSGPRFLHL